MDYCKKAYVIAKIHIFQWRKDVRVHITAGMEVVLMIRYLIGMTIYGLQYGTNITPCLLPVLFTDATISNGLLKILIYLGGVLLFSDAPFMDEKSPYVIVRSKRKAWWMGECLYLWIASFLYMIFIMLISIVVLLPTISTTQLWGTTLVDFVQEVNNCAIYKGNLELPREVIEIVYPYMAQLFTFLTGFLSFVFLGHLAFALNLLTGRKVLGIGAMVFFVMLDPVVYWLGFGKGNHWMYQVSPVSWSSIQHWDFLGVDRPLNMWYIFSMYAVLIVILTIIISYAAKKKQIDVVSLQ